MQKSASDAKSPAQGEIYAGPPFAASGSSSLAKRADNSNVSIALATFPTSMLNDAASPGVISPAAVASAEQPLRLSSRRPRCAQNFPRPQAGASGSPTLDNVPDISAE
jgi:hypothetical protein